jgi:hypothetical protein
MPELAYSIFGTLSGDETFIKGSGVVIIHTPCYLSEYFFINAGFTGLDDSYLGKSLPGISWSSLIIRDDMLCLQLSQHHKTIGY